MEDLNAMLPLPETENPEAEARKYGPEENVGPATLSTAGTIGSPLEALSALLNETLEQARPRDFSTPKRPLDLNQPAAGSVVISGTGFGVSEINESVTEGDGKFNVIGDLVNTAAMLALKDGGIPLIEREAIKGRGEHQKDDWILPEPLRQETGLIIAPAYPARKDLLRIQSNYDAYKRIVDRLKILDQPEESSGRTRAEQMRDIIHLLRELTSDPDNGQDPPLAFEMLAHDYSQLAGHIGAQGPVTQLNPGGASASEAISLAGDWIRAGRCRRVMVICTTEGIEDGLLRWLGVHPDAAVRTAAGNGKHGSSREIDDAPNIGAPLGAYALIIESEDALRERGMRGVAEMLGSESLSLNSGSDRDLIDHTADSMERLVDGAERRFVLYRAEMAAHLVFLTGDESQSDRDYPIGIAALKSVFGALASSVVVTASTALSVRVISSGLETAIAMQILESGVPPPAPDSWLEMIALDPFLLSNGKNYAPHYLLTLTGLSQARVAITLLRSVPGEIERIDDVSAYHQWVIDISGYEQVFVEARSDMLRLVGQKVPGRKPKASAWRFGIGPTLLAIKHPWEAPRTSVDVEPQQAEVPAPLKPSIPDEELRAAEMLLGTDFDALDVQILMIAAEHTGYALEDLDIDQDLKQEMGLDAKEHAELLIEICQVFDVSGYVNLNTGHYPTLAHIIALVRDRRPDLLVSKDEDVQDAQIEVPSIPIIEVPPGRDGLQVVTLKIVSDRTGYPADVLEQSLDMDLDQDLGIDAAEKLEIFRALCQTFSLECPDSHQLLNYLTLSQIVRFLKKRISDEDLSALTGSSIAERPQPVELRQELDSEVPDIDEPPIEFAISKTVLLIATELTDIPAQRLDIAADMIDGLGLDQRTQSEVVTTVLESFGIPQSRELRPSDYPTLGSLIVFVRRSRPDLQDEVLTQDVRADDLEVAEDETTLSVARRLTTRVESKAVAEEPAAYIRYIPSPTQLPPLIECYPTGISLTGKRVVVMADRGGVADELATQLREFNVKVLPLIAKTPIDELEEQILGWIDEGAVDGVYWLPALDVEPALPHMSIDTWRELNRQRVKNLHRIMRALYDSINHPKSFLVVATRMGGMHGLGYSDVPAPLGGSAAGFAKAYREEHRRAGDNRDQIAQGQNGRNQKEAGLPLVKVIDLEVDCEPFQVANILVDETLSDLEAIEIGYVGSDRHGVTLVEIATNHEPGLALNGGTVYVITGAARRMTNDIVVDLARNGGTFYLLDMIAKPDPDDPRIALFRKDKKALREQLFEEIKTVVPEPTASMIDKIAKAIEREEAVLRAIELIEEQGGRAYYQCIDLLDDSAVEAYIEDIYQEHGRIDVLFHAAGLEINRPLPQKDPLQFDLVYDVKADGLFNLLKASEAKTLKTFVVFGSMDSLNGDWGQIDSNAANELLRKMTSSLSWQRSDTRGIAISRISRGTTGSNPGSDSDESPLVSSSDFSYIRRELTASSYHGEVIFQVPGAEST
jgi:NAD(P)-dependent dehydrogenase (short-subunit alcohol dehydrogenase family)/acyl carrier protein